MSDVVLLETSERIATITLNRPEVRNALSREVSRRLQELLREAEHSRTTTSSSSPGPIPPSVPASTSKSSDRRAVARFSVAPTTRRAVDRVARCHR